MSPFPLASGDRDTLEALFRSTGGDRWEKKASWATDADLSTWHGVLLDKGGRVVKLDLRFNNLRGDLRDSFCLLAIILISSNVSPIDAYCHTSTVVLCKLRSPLQTAFG